MRILEDFKLPKLKFPKFKMLGLSNIKELDVDFDPDKVHGSKENEKKNITGYTPTTFKSIREVFDSSTIKYKDNVFILQKYEHKEPYKEIKYNDFKEDVIGFCTGLSRLLGLNKKRIVIIGENNYHWYVSYMSLLCGDFIAVPVDKDLPQSEIENVIFRSKASAIIYSSKNKDAIDKIIDTKKCPTVNYYIQMNSDNPLDISSVGMNTVIIKGKDFVSKGDLSFNNVNVDPRAFKVLLFTSGTTSNAKGVMLCHENLAENINACTAYVNLGENDRLLSILPLHHTYESTIGFLYPFAVGASIAVCEGLKHIVPNLKEAKPTSLLTVPLLVENLYKKINENIKKSKKEAIVNSMIHITNALKSAHIDIKKKVFSEIHDSLGGNIRYIVSAAAPIDPKIGKWLENIGITFLQGYGLTETAPIASLTPDFKPKIGSVGKPIICGEIKISNPNSSGEGEILIKSKTLMLQYYEDDAATKAVVKDGWFHTGDLGYLDEEGYLYVTGRCKNVIVTQNGKNIYPEEIESVLSGIPEISECMVYGMEKQGEKELIITTLVIPEYSEIERKHGNNLSEDEIYRIIWNQIKEKNKTLSAYKTIKHLVIKKEEFEKTTTMKIKRFVEIEKQKEANKGEQNEAGNKTSKEVK